METKVNSSPIPGTGVFDISGISTTQNVQAFVIAAGNYSDADTKATAADLQEAASKTQEEATNSNTAQQHWTTNGDTNPNDPGFMGWDCYIWMLENNKGPDGNKLDPTTGVPVVTQLYSNASSALSAKNTQVDASAKQYSSTGDIMQGVPAAITSMLQNVLEVLQIIIQAIGR